MKQHLCCLIHPVGKSVCYVCKQTSCREHQDKNGLTHTYCSLSKEMKINNLIKAAETAYDHLREYIKDSGECDHSVGICNCESIRALESLDTSLCDIKGKKVCYKEMYEPEEWGL